MPRFFRRDPPTNYFSRQKAIKNQTRPDTCFEKNIGASVTALAPICLNRQKITRSIDLRLGSQKIFGFFGKRRSKGADGCFSWHKKTEQRPSVVKPQLFMFLRNGIVFMPFPHFSETMLVAKSPPNPSKFQSPASVFRQSSAARGHTRALPNHSRLPASTPADPNTYALLK